LTSTKGPSSGNTPHSQRRQAGGARREASERVQIRAPGFESSGWTLNVSRGGLRAVFEDALDPEREYEVCVGDEAARKARVAWSRAEADGQIVGLRFLDVDGSVPPEDDKASPAAPNEKAADAAGRAPVPPGKSGDEQ
jgi:hypothetical protein